MSRPLRIEIAGGVYHVIVRGNERKAVFRDDADRAKYLDGLSYYREKFSFQVLSANFTRSLPKAPEGEYVIIQYDTQFEKGDSSSETVVTMREKDGSWRVAGYFFK